MYGRKIDMVTAEKTELRVAIPAGPQENEDARHSDGSRLAIPTHRLLRRGGGYEYELPGRLLSTLIQGTNIRLIEYRGSDIPKAVADGDADMGFSTSDKALNLPDEEFDENGNFKRIEIMRELGYGGCEYRAGYIEALGYPASARLAVAEGLVVGIALQNLARRIFVERNITPAEFIYRDGHVENTIPLHGGRAEVILDIYETGGSMRENHIIPSDEQLLLFQAILIRHRGNLGSNIEEMLEAFSANIGKIVENPDGWMRLGDKGLPSAKRDFRVPKIPGIRQLTFPNTSLVA